MIPTDPMTIAIIKAVLSIAGIVGCGILCTKLGIFGSPNYY